jgi:hypothetical protein
MVGGESAGTGSLHRLVSAFLCARRQIRATGHPQQLSTESSEQATVLKSLGRLNLNQLKDLGA